MSFAHRASPCDAPCHSVLPDWSPLHTQATSGGYYPTSEIASEGTTVEKSKVSRHRAGSPAAWNVLCMRSVRLGLPMQAHAVCDLKVVATPLDPALLRVSWDVCSGSALTRYNAALRCAGELPLLCGTAKHHHSSRPTASAACCSLLPPPSPSMHLDPAVPQSRRSGSPHGAHAGLLTWICPCSFSRKEFQAPYVTCFTRLTKHAHKHRSPHRVTCVIPTPTVRKSCRLPRTGPLRSRRGRARCPGPC